MENEILQALRQNLHVLRELALRYQVMVGPSQEGLFHIETPEDAVTLLKDEMENLAQEQLRVLSLNTRNHVIDQTVLYQGNVNSSVVRICEIMRPAILNNATNIIVAHNHPSGDPTPSPQDCSVTRDLLDMSKTLGIELLDHIVLGKNGRYLSLKEARLGGF